MRILGIDISDNWLDFAICNEEVDFQTKKETVDNTEKGVKQMLKALKKHGGTPENTWVCCEHTGHYGLLLINALGEAGYSLCMLSPLELKKSIGLTRGKDDQVDAMRIAEYGAIRKHKLKATKLPSCELLELKQLFTLRAQLVRYKTGLTNSKKPHQASERYTQSDLASTIVQGQINQLKARIKEVEKRMKEIVQSDKQLASTFDLITSVKGIGPMIAYAMIIYTQNFTCFTDPRKFTCYAGMAPFANSSGKHKGKTKTSNFRNKYIKTLFMSGATSAIIYDRELSHYYKRKVSEGKLEGKVKNAVCCKLVYRAFAVVKRGTKYVEHGQPTATKTFRYSSAFPMLRPLSAKAQKESRVVPTKEGALAKPLTPLELGYLWPEHWKKQEFDLHRT